jgi:hypothetical protein
MDVIQRFFEDRHATEIIKDTINIIYDAFDRRLDEIEQEKLEIPKVTGLAMIKLQEVIHLATMEYDGVTTSEEPFEKFDADGEPYPSKIDSWARGMGKFMVDLVVCFIVFII